MTEEDKKDLEEALERLKATKEGETVCLAYRHTKTLLELIEELLKGENEE